MLLIKHAELDGRPTDLRCTGGQVSALGTDLEPASGEIVIQAEGGALLPGLHDHHLHFLACAAALDSVRCGHPDVADRTQLRAALDAAATGIAREKEWVRGIGYHESVAGLLDRHALDDLLASRPVRLQHRSGKLWMLNSAACDAVELDRHPDLDGVERGSDGRPTGRLYRLDGWLGERLGRETPPVAQMSSQLAAAGVTGFTDATPANSNDTVMAFEEFVAAGEVRQRVRFMSSQRLRPPDHPKLTAGEFKVILDEDSLPDLDDLTVRVARAHDEGRAAAIHCVTPTELLVAMAAIKAAGPGPGDRLEHAAVTRADVLEDLAALGLTIVTQTNFIHERGDQYLVDVEPADLGALYRARTYLTRRIPVALGTDAPFGEPDPWAAMHAAVERRTASGATIGVDERLSPEEALGMFTGRPESPARPRTVAVGGAADLCLLDRPWAEARHRLRREDVAATICEGEIIHARADTRVSRPGL